MDEPKVTRESASTVHATLTEVTTTADGESIVVGYVLHVAAGPYPYRILTAGGSLYAVHMTEGAANKDVDLYAALLADPTTQRDT